MSSEWKLPIAGELHNGTSMFNVVNPATEQVFAQAPKADKPLLEVAIAAAEAAFPAWRMIDIADRQKMFQQLAERIKERSDRYVETLIHEVGKPVREAELEVRMTIGLIRSGAKVGEIPIETVHAADGRVASIRRRPLGVVAGITPWNMPLMQPAMKLMQTLSTGNCIVLKVAPSAPLSGLLLGADALEIFPSGTVNVLADENELGPLLTSHPGIAKIAFTGSTVTGRKIMESSAPTLKRLTMELGGSDAAIILEDVDVEKVAKQLFWGAMFNCGQICTAPKRFYVAEQIYDQFCDALIALTKKVIVGDPTDPQTRLGPLQNRIQYEKVMGYMDDANRNGVVCSGGRALDQPGYFVEPTIVRDIEDGARVVDEEQFGPIMPIIRINNEQDALSRANKSPYGLGGSVWCADQERGAAIAANLECGMAWVNAHNAVVPDTPYSGAKQSGYGAEGGEETIRAFTQVSVVVTTG